MKIKSLVITTILLTLTIWSQAQQINPVPDYVFRNQMSVGRNAVTDTAAYFSIGPRYGATKGFMPPIVGDTATFSSGKRNGLLIFSVQKNKFLYWDSVRVQWSDMAGSSGSYIVAGDTASMLSKYLRKSDTTAMLTPYVRHAGYGLTKSGQSFLVDTLNIATRAWRQKGLDSLAALEVSGSGTTNYIPKFTASSTIGNSQIFDNGTNVGIGITTGMSERFNVANSSGNANASISTSSATSGAFLRFGNTTNADGLYLGYNNPTGSLFGGVGGANGGVIMGYGAYPIGFGTNATERLRITSGGDVGIGTTSPNIYSSGAFKYLTVSNNTASGYSFVTVAGGAGGGGEIDFGNQTIRHAAIASLDGSILGFYTNNTNSGTGVTERLRIFANGRVGINTTTDAGYQLDVNGTLRSVNGANFATTSGNVGIGTTSPTERISILSPSATSAAISFRGNNLSAAEELFLGQGTAGNYFVFGRGNYDMSFGTNNSTRMAITSGGNVGIGTASPSAKLTVVGAGAQTILNSGSAADGRMEFHYNSSREGFISWDTDNIRLQADAGNYLTFFTNATERGRINSAGEWIIDASGTDAGNYKLQVSGQAFIRNTATSGGLYLDSTSLSIDEVKNRHAILISAHSLTGAEIQGPIYVGTNWNTSSDVSAIEVALTNTASGANSNLMKLSDGTNTFRVTKDAEVVTAAPTGGSIRKWKLGEAATVSPTSPNRTIRVEIDGTVYYLHAKTTND